MKKEWFSAAQIAAEALPELPANARGVSRIAERARWDRCDLARPRAGKGGGLEYHYSLLPDAAQAVLLVRYGQTQTMAVPANVNLPATWRNEPSADLWKRFELLPQKFKDEARYRLSVLVEFDDIAAVEGGPTALKMIVKEYGVSAQTLRNWLDIRKKTNKHDLLAALAPEKRGGAGKKAEFAEEAWEFFKGDYLRLGEPSMESCFGRLRRAARQHGWILPSEKTMRRRMDAVPEAVKILARKGPEAAKKLYPSQKRDRSMFRALEAVNADGHKWDVFVRWEDGTIGRPVMLAFQDLYSGKFLSWRYGKTEHSDLVRLALGDLCFSFGIPDKCWLDNGRAFASKQITGGAKNRYRWPKAGDQVGIMPQLGIEVHWATPYSGQSKPIERGFGTLARDISRGPWFQGAFTGNAPGDKPEDYGSRAVPIADFKRIVDHEIMMHNAKPGRSSDVCGGKLSFNEAFDASYAEQKDHIRRASDEQIRLCLLSSEEVRAHTTDGTLHLKGNRYWHQALIEERGNKLTMRYDPDNLHDDIAVYRQDGTFVCVALLQEAAGFADTGAAREHAKARGDFVRANREMLKAERSLSAADVVSLMPKIPVPPTRERVATKACNGNAAIKAEQVEAADDEFDLHFSKGLRLVRDLAGDF